MSRLEPLARLERLRGMTPREIAHRLREKGSIARERLNIAARWPRAPQPFKQYLARARARFYRGVSGFSPDFAEIQSPEMLNAENRAVELLNLGQVQLGSPMDWNRDPVTGKVWERRFWADYDLENDPAGRDSKIIHELNRHQHLPRLANAFLLTGNEQFASQALAHIESWIDQNPAGQGVQWHSSLEIAIRSISWLWTLFMLVPSRSLDERGAQRAGDSLFAQLEHVYRHLSAYSSPNTHLIGEATALFIAGLMFEECRCAKAWLARATGILIRESEKQIFEDGVYGERSTYYHCYALDFYLQALILAQVNRVALPRAVWNRVEKMLEFLMHVTRPDGTIPLLGDDDGGRALALNQRTYRGFLDALSTGAVLFRRGDFKHQSAKLWEETYWLLGEQGCSTYHSIESKAPRESSLFCAQGGYAVQRSGWGERDSHAIFDFGGLGLFNGGHAHAGCLSISLFADGRERLVDPGTFVYNGAPSWRSYFRSTRAHNTVAIDGREQAQAGGTFRWNSKIASRAARRAEPPVEYIEAEHKGYSPVVHRRRVLYVEPGYWIAADDFRGPGAHTFEFLFQLGEDFMPVVHTSPEAKIAVEAGWRSRGYGHKEAIHTLCAKCSGSPEAVRAVSLLIPSGREAVVERLQVEKIDAIACSIQHGVYRDIAVLLPPGGEADIEDIRFRGEFCWVRLEAGTVQHVFTSGGGEVIPEGAICARSAAS